MESAQRWPALLRAAQADRGRPYADLDRSPLGHGHHLHPAASRGRERVELPPDAGARALAQQQERGRGLGRGQKNAHSTAHYGAYAFGGVALRGAVRGLHVAGAVPEARDRGGLRRLRRGARTGQAPPASAVFSTRIGRRMPSGRQPALRPRCGRHNRSSMRSPEGTSSTARRFVLPRRTRGASSRSS